MTVTSDDAVVEFDYDDTGQVIAERINGRSVSYQYDASGQRTVTRLDGVALHLDWGCVAIQREGTCAAEPGL
ncbi:RHS repeat domain-containing protein [Entomohabitans teleogrylli]|uniref:RHS repeat domain-containing protein n=1 Tax=Entomohabitans teleogrylli TaxID=1384589 RepID=UPI00073D2859